MRLAYPALLSCVLFAAACGGEDLSGGDDDPGPDAGGEGGFCGGFTGQQCAEGFWCDYPDNACGAADGGGTCRPRPEGCDDNYDPVCACNGEVYGNECGAQSAGVDVADNGGCEAPTDSYACGHEFCASFTEYCQVFGSDIGGEPSYYSCEPVPSSCGGNVTCACLEDETCGDICEGEASDLTLICPGG